MKSLLRKLALVLFGALILVQISCNNDDDGESPDPADPSNPISYAGIEYTINAATYSNNGNYDSFNQDFEQNQEESTFESATHYGYDFVLTDGTLDSTNSITGATITIQVQLFSGSTGSFQTGTFRYAAPLEVSENPNIVADQSYFTSLSVNLDGEQRQASSGTVTVTGSGNNWSLVFDVTLGVSTTLKGQHSGTFTDTTEEDEG